MKIVVDTNILFSFFWRSSLTRKLLITSNLELLSPEKALIEINKYKKKVIEKIKIKEKEFNELFNELKSVVKFVDKKVSLVYLNKAKQISPDLADIDFFALCLQNSCPLWSNDKILKNQSEIKVFNTDEIIDIFV